jgi:hypothetical protein
VLWAVQRFTETHLLLYAAVGVGASFATGYLASLMLPGGRRSIQGLTIYTIGDAITADSSEAPT